MKHKDFIKKEYDRFFATVDRLDFTSDKQITKFIRWCFDKHFLDALSVYEIEDFYVDAEDNNMLILPGLTANDITIYFFYRNDGKEDPLFVTGIDPAKCYGGMLDSSIVMYFPITSKREEELFYRTLEAILDKRSNISREWFANAESYRNGTYMTNQR